MPLWFGWIEVHAVDHCNNNCRWCNNSSPFFAESFHEADEYFPWLDIFVKNQIRYNHISIMGGEPFLHPDLPGFMEAMQRRYNKPMMLTTNGFWLCEEAIKAYHPVWKLTKLLFISYYPNLLKTIGGEAKADALLDSLGRAYPHMEIRIRRKNQFTELDYSSAPLNVEFFCNMSECTALRPDGTLARCGFGAFAHQNPYVDSEFLDSQEMYFDLKLPFKPGRFWHWRNRWPLDSCAHCTGILDKQTCWKIQKGTQRRHQDEVKIHIGNAVKLYNEGQHDTALARMENLREAYPKAKEVCNDLGVLYYHEKKTEQAIQLLEHALELDPEYKEARSNYITLLKKKAITAQK